MSRADMRAARRLEPLRLVRSGAGCTTADSVVRPCLQVNPKGYVRKGSFSVREPSTSPRRKYTAVVSEARAVGGEARAVVEAPGETNTRQLARQSVERRTQK